MHRMAAITSFLLLPLSACGESESVTPQEQQAPLSSAQLMNAMVASYPGLKITIADAQDRFQQVEDRLLDGHQWPTSGGDCLKRLSAGGFVRLLGEAGAQAPTAMRVWGTDPNDTRVLQFLVALPGDGAETVVRSSIPRKCFRFWTEDQGLLLHWTVTDRSLPLGNGGRFLKMNSISDKTEGRNPTVLFAYKGVLAFLRFDERTNDFPELALKRMQEQL